MAVENWKLWLSPFGVWGLAMAWYSGYQSGYLEGHETAWQMSRPNVLLAIDGQQPRTTELDGSHLDDD